MCWKDSWPQDTRVEQVLSFICTGLLSSRIDKQEGVESLSELPIQTHQYVIALALPASIWDHLRELAGQVSFSGDTIILGSEFCA